MRVGNSFKGNEAIPSSSIDKYFRHENGKMLGTTMLSVYPKRIYHQIAVTGILWTRKNSLDT